MPEISLTIASRLDAVPLLGQLVGFICSSAGLTPVEENEVQVCVVEAVNNSIKHAYKEDPRHKVEVDINWLRTELIFDVWDSGVSADPKWMHSDHFAALDMDPDRLQDIAESGRGLAIIQQVMDSSEYTPGPDRNRFRLIKRLSGV